MKKITLISALCVATSFTTQAELRINGFANLVGGITGSDETFLGYDDTISFDQESLFTLQVSGDINEKMTATGQIVARGENDYSAQFEWAYIAYAYSDNTTITAGRFRLPLFNFSASLDVGYSYHWMTVPSVVYDVPFNNMDGVKIDYSTYSGDWEYNLGLAFGAFKAVIGVGTETTGDNTVLLSAEAINGPFKLRGVYGRTDASLDLEGSTNPNFSALNGAFNAIETVGLPELADNLRFEDDLGQFIGVSLQYDNFDWFIGGEVTYNDVADTFTDSDESFYVTLGKRFGKWTPSLTYQDFISEGNVKYADQIAQLALLPLPQEVILGLQGAAIGSQLAEKLDYSITSLTLRYDLDVNVALKADLSKRSDNNDDNDDATTLRVALNYVF